MSSESTEKDDSTAINANQSTDHKDRKTIYVDGRPVDPSEVQITKFLDIDGKRPVTSSKDQSTDFKALRTIDIDGHRPVDPSELQIEKFIDIDGKRPVTASDIEIHKMIQDDGNRPIASDHPEQTEITTDYMD